MKSESGPVVGVVGSKKEVTRNEDISTTSLTDLVGGSVNLYTQMYVFTHFISVSTLTKGLRLRTFLSDSPLVCTRVVR